MVEAVVRQRDVRQLLDDPLAQRAAVGPLAELLEQVAEVLGHVDELVDELAHALVLALVGGGAIDEVGDVLELLVVQHPVGHRKRHHQSQLQLGELAVDRRGGLAEQAVEERTHAEAVGTNRRILEARIRRSLHPRSG